MALRSGYKGFKKLFPGLKLFRPGTLGIDNDVLIPELNKTFFPRSEQAVLGAKNLLENTATSQSVNGVAYVVNADGTVTANNKATANAMLRLNKIYNLPSGTYKYTGCPSGGGSSTYQGWVGIRNAGDTAWLSSYTDTGSGVEFTVDASQTSYVQVEVEVRNNYTADNLLFYPMIRLATDTDPTYQPYAMTNKELTEQATPIHTEATASTGTGSGDVSLNEADYKSIVKIGKVVYFNVRFNIGTVTSTSEIRLVNLGYAPDAKYPVISLRKRNAPYEEVCGVYINFSGEVTVYGKALETGDYWITGTYICK